ANIMFNVIFFKPFGYVGIVMSSILSSYLNLFLLITKLIRRKLFYFEKFFIAKLLKIAIPSILMAFSLMLMKSYFEFSNDTNNIIELIAMISFGLIIYFISSYFSGSFDILLRSGLFKKRKSSAI
ncbi:MAG TPA: lipid II flippase MurJ, partial [Rickettsiales bacterium]|nr:lipid II flippase MurJ [Rickettsiales bacterium]